MHTVLVVKCTPLLGSRRRDTEYTVDSDDAQKTDSTDSTDWFREQACA